MILRNRLRQLDKSGRSPPLRVIIKVQQPKGVEKYYARAGTINMHNRIERNTGTGGSALES